MGVKDSSCCSYILDAHEVIIIIQVANEEVTFSQVNILPKK